METYDWRLSLPNLQLRDKYFTQVKHRVELLHELHGEKVPNLHHPPTFHHLVHLSYAPMISSESCWRTGAGPRQNSNAPEMPWLLALATGSGAVEGGGEVQTS